LPLLIPNNGSSLIKKHRKYFDEEKKKNKTDGTISSLRIDNLTEEKE
jgi:hypothetical protein